MKSTGQKKLFNQTILSGAITTALAAGIGLGAAGIAQADIYQFTYNVNIPTTAEYNAGDIKDCILINDNGTPGDFTDDTIDCPDGDALFTMLDPLGVVLRNTSAPFYYDTSWGTGRRSQINGRLSFEDADRVGSVTMAPFAFFNKGDATASGIVLKEVLNNTGEGPNPGGPLWLANMNFNWNNGDIVTQVVWDATGLFDQFPLVFDEPADIAAVSVISGVGATPASNDSFKGNVPIGSAPVATSNFDVAIQGSNLPGYLATETTLADLSLGNFITPPNDSNPSSVTEGGSPMDNGPFGGFNANFDFTTLALTGYNDTTVPTIVVNPASVNLAVNDSFNPANPAGVSITCSDAKDGNDTLAANTNSNITFATPVSDVDMTTAGVYTVTYTCSDNASRWAAVQNPTNPGTVATPVLTTPTDNDASSVDLSVNVANAGQPVITLNGVAATSHEACTLYTDAGATATDGPPDNNTITPVLVTDPDNIDGDTNPAEGVSLITYNISNGGTAATPVVRTITVSDTVAPVITIPGDIIIEATEVAGFAIPAGSALDGNNDCNPTGAVVRVGALSDNIPAGALTAINAFTYNATDSSLNSNAAAEKTLNITVERSEPVITLLDENGDPVAAGNITLEIGEDYVEFGVNIIDVQSGSANGVKADGSQNSITYTVTSTVDTSTSGVYTVTYTAVDADGNAATDVERTVAVANASDTGIGNFTMLDPNGIGIGGTNDVVYVWDGSISEPAGAEPDGDGYTVPSDVTSVMTIASNEPFNGFNWTAKTIRVYRGPVKLKFDATCQDEDNKANPPVTLCGKSLDEQKVSPSNAPDPGERYIKLDLAEGEIGAHMTFDWGSTDSSTPCGQSNCDIDVILRWEEADINDLTKGIWNGDGGKLYLEEPYLLVDENGELAPPALDTPWLLVSTDVPQNGVPLADGGIGDGINGRPMIDGPFNQFHVSFNLGPVSSGEPPVPVLSTIDPVKVDNFSMGLWPLMASLFSVFGLRSFGSRKLNNKK